MIAIEETADALLAVATTITDPVVLRSAFVLILTDADVPHIPQSVLDASVNEECVDFVTVQPE